MTKSHENIPFYRQKDDKMGRAFATGTFEKRSLDYLHDFLGKTSSG